MEMVHVCLPASDGSWQSPLNIPMPTLEEKLYTIWLATHIQKYSPDLIPLVRAIYGSGDPNTYPQSICSYFQDLLTQRFWADEIVLKALSLMYNITITVLRAENGAEIRVRHRRPISEVDIVLVWSQSGHYSPAGQYPVENIDFLFNLGLHVPSN